MRNYSKYRKNNALQQEEHKIKRMFMVGMSDHIGGVETYVNNITEMLADEFEIIFDMPEMTIDGKVWHRPPNRHNFIEYCFFWKKFFSANHFDLLYYNTCDIVSIDLLQFAKAANVPIRIIHSHCADTTLKLDFFHQIEEKISRKRVDKYATHLFACSKIAGDWMFGDKEYTILKNGINIAKYRYDPDAGKKCRSIVNVDSELVVGFVGRLSPPKNPLFAIQIAKAMFEVQPSAKFVMIGDGTLRQDVEDEIAKNHLENRVVLTGAVDHVHEWLSAMNVLLMPSLFEGLPFVLVEAQANSLPCVVSSEVSQEANIGGLIDYVDLNQPLECWAEKVVQAAQKGRVDVSKKLIEEGYSIEDTVRKILKVIDNI